MGDQLVFYWDWLENLLITCDRPFGTVVTNTKCQSWVSHVQMQCTIAVVSDAQTEGRVSVTPKSWLPRNNTKTYYIQNVLYILQNNASLRGICQASVWSAITTGTKEYSWPTNRWIIFMYYLVWLKNVLFRQLVNSMQNQVQSNQPSGTRRPTGWSDQPVVHPWSILVFKLHFLLVRILNSQPQVFVVNLC